MGIWIETGVFLLVLAFGIWQIQDVKRERRKRSQARDAQGNQGADLKSGSSSRPEN
jgi:ABC-type nickel/cobalt efflux system permease component RcnA